MTRAEIERRLTPPLRCLAMVDEDGLATLDEHLTLDEAKALLIYLLSGSGERYIYNTLFEGKDGSNSTTGAI